MSTRTGLTFEKLLVATAMLALASIGAWAWSGRFSWSLSAGAVVMGVLAWSRRSTAQKRDTSVNPARHAESDSER